MLAVIVHGQDDVDWRSRGGHDDVINVHARLGRGRGGCVTGKLPAQLRIRSEFSSSKIIVEELEAVIDAGGIGRDRAGAGVDVGRGVEDEGGAAADGAHRGVRGEAVCSDGVAGIRRSRIGAHGELRGGVDAENARAGRNAAASGEEHADGKCRGGGRRHDRAVDGGAARDVNIGADDRAPRGESAGARAGHRRAAGGAASRVGDHIG